MTAKLTVPVLYKSPPPLHKILMEDNAMRPTTFLSAVLCGLLFLILQDPGRAQEKKYPIDVSKDFMLPKGAKLEILAEHPSPLADFEKVQIARLTMNPGTKIENFVVPTTDFCHIAKGELAVTMPDGSVMIVKEGDHFPEAKGTVYNVLENKGTVVCEDYMFQLIEKAAK